MTQTYRFRYESKSQLTIYKINRHLPLIITVPILFNAALCFYSIVLAKSDSFSTEVFFIAFAVFVVMGAVLCLSLIYGLFFCDNNSITDIHWDFNQEVVISDHKIVSTLTWENNTFQEERFLMKVIKAKKATCYYQDRHHYVVIPNCIQPISNMEASI